MASKEESFYNKLTEAIDLRAKQKNSFLEEAIHLREKCTSAMISFQDLVHPKKWVILEEMKKHLHEEIESLKEAAPHSPDNKYIASNFDAISEENLNEINEAIKKSEDFLRNYENELNSTS